MNWITLTTDFTEHDGYVGVMKGVIAGIAPQARVIDLSHTVAPQDVFQAALLLGRSVPYFPAGTVHVAVVDPGVGTARRGIAALLGEKYFVGPDNGLLTLLYQQTQAQGETVRIHALENPDYRLAQVSRTFHGRDIFAPAAAHLAAGAPLESFGAAVMDPILLEMPQAQKTADGLIGSIIHVDAFGNLASNIRAETLADFENIHIILRNTVIEGISATFGNKAQGELVAVIDSFGFLSICVVNGSAAQQLRAVIGEQLQIVRS
jgi:S-adenosylmethionine hydrolase